LATTEGLMRMEEGFKLTDVEEIRFIELSKMLVI